MRRAQKRASAKEQLEPNLPLEEEERGSPIKARWSSCAAPSDYLGMNECIFCDKPDKPSNLLSASATLAIFGSKRQLPPLMPPKINHWRQKIAADNFTNTCVNNASLLNS